MISIVIPTLNRGDFLPQVVGAVSREVDQLNLPYEIILVDDGSSDETSNVLKHICKRNTPFRGIVLKENRGQQNATLAGIRASRYPYVLTLDDDLEYDVRKIPDIIKGLDAGFDAVYIVNKRQDAAMYRLWGTLLKEWVFDVFCHKPREIRLTSFRGMQRSIADYIAQDTVRNVYISARLLQHTRHILNICSDYSPQKRRPTNYRRRLLVRLLWHVIRNYGDIPGMKRFRETGNQYDIKEMIPCD